MQGLVQSPLYAYRRECSAGFVFAPVVSFHPCLGELHSAKTVFFSDRVLTW